MRFKSENAKDDDLLHPYLFSIKERASLEFGQLLRTFKMGIVSDPAKGKRRQVNSKTFHCIRATCATLLQNGGVSSDMAAKLVGHDSEDVHKQYVRPDDEQLRKVANLMPKLAV